MLPDDFAERLVIFGAGGLGRRIARFLCNLGHPPLAFCDNKVRGIVEGLQVLSPAVAASQFPHAVFMVAIWHPSRTQGLRHRVLELQSAGCKNVTTFIPLFWQYADEFLPETFLDLPANILTHGPEIRAARALFDTAGKTEFDRQLNLRLHADISGDPDPGVQYFPSDFFPVSDEEYFVDCGAYDGDTFQSFVAESGGQFSRFVALEPDPDNFSTLQKRIPNDDRVCAYPFAVGSRREILPFASNADSSSISTSGDLQVQSVRLDELLEGQRPTYIKMDIEGFELDALGGARKLLRSCRPKLAVCVYHRPDHLWRVPLLIHELIPDCRMTLRTYQVDGWDSVCYAVPEHDAIRLAA